MNTRQPELYPDDELRRHFLNAVAFYWVAWLAAGEGENKQQDLRRRGSGAANG